MISALLLAAAIVSPQLHPDGRVTFRLDAPKAATVKLWGEWIPKYNTVETLEKSPGGPWTITIGPIPPNLYSYLFLVDGLPFHDPNNPAVFTGHDGNATSLLHLPAPSPEPHQPRPGPKGVLHTHSEPANFTVYTPPGYNPNAPARYPVLYLLHGSGDTHASWVNPGRANVIADNLIAAGQLRPLLIVLPDGHAISRANPNLPIAFLDQNYKTIPHRRGRAIAGLSMGAFQAAWIALDSPQTFGALAAFSGGLAAEESDPQIAALAQSKTVFHPLTLAIGDRDINLPFTRRLATKLTEHNITHDFSVVPNAGHNWPFWRQAVAGLLPRLFPLEEEPPR